MIARLSLIILALIFVSAFIFDVANAPVSSKHVQHKLEKAEANK